MSTPERPEQITRTTRDHAEVRDRLQRWLATHLPDAQISELRVPGSGMSSETLLFDAVWPEGTGSFAARLAPPHDAVPVFPRYDLAAQYRVIRIVEEHSSAPVPVVRWLETDETALGAPFFVMEQVHGDVPPDVMPYTVEGFVLEADERQRRQLQDATVDALVAIHSVDLGRTDTTFLHLDAPGETPLRRHVEHWRSYYDWVRRGRSIPVLDEALEWLDAHWPAEAERQPSALSWGDARIGNVMYRDFRPVAVLDWEMAAIAPREVDLGWMSFLHTFFQDIAEMLGLPGLPDMFRADDLDARYRATSGVELADLHWFEVYAAFRHGAVMARVRDRQVHFGEAEPVEHPDHAVMHHARLRSMIGG